MRRHTPYLPHTPHAQDRPAPNCPRPPALRPSLFPGCASRLPHGRAGATSLRRLLPHYPVPTYYHMAGWRPASHLPIPPLHMWRDACDNTPQHAHCLLQPPAGFPHTTRTPTAPHPKTLAAARGGWRLSVNFFICTWTSRIFYITNKPPFLRVYRTRCYAHAPASPYTYLRAFHSTPLHIARSLRATRRRDTEYFRAGGDSPSQRRLRLTWPRDHSRLYWTASSPSLPPYSHFSRLTTLRTRFSLGASAGRDGADLAYSFSSPVFSSPPLSCRSRLINAAAATSARTTPLLARGA